MNPGEALTSVGHGAFDIVIGRRPGAGVDQLDVSDACVSLSVSVAQHYPCNTCDPGRCGQALVDVDLCLSYFGLDRAGIEDKRQQEDRERHRDPPGRESNEDVEYRCWGTSEFKVL